MVPQAPAAERQQVQHTMSLANVIGAVALLALGACAFTQGALMLACKPQLTRLDRALLSSVCLVLLSLWKTVGVPGPDAAFLAALC